MNRSAIRMSSNSTQLQCEYSKNPFLRVFLLDHASEMNRSYQVSKVLILFFWIWFGMIVDGKGRIKKRNFYCTLNLTDVLKG
jgi:hypothetical protein